MRAERLTPIEQELWFKEWCRQNGVIRFLFDIDDTICGTRKNFGKYQNEVYDFLATAAPVRTRDEWKTIIEATNNKLFETYGVNPRRWDMVVDEVACQTGLTDGIQQRIKGTLAKIYTTPLQMLPGAEAGLDFIRKVDVPAGFVTHAGEEWTWRKYDWLGLNRYCDWDDVYIVDQDGHKTAREWEKALKYFGVEARQVCVVGDSPRSDINPVWEIGVRNCFLINDLALWSVHVQPVDAGVKKVGDLSGIIEVTIGEMIRGRKS